MATFTITSFNALWGRTPDGVPYDLVAAVAGFDTDVIALQEVWVPADDDAGSIHQLGQLGYEVLHLPLSPSSVTPRPEITHRPEEAAGTWGVALLSRIPVARWREVDLGHVVERWDVAHRRAVLADLDLEGRMVTVAAHHLSFVLPNAAAQLRRLGQWLPTDRPTVVAGDCNLWGPVAARALGRHRRAVRGRTWPAHRPHSQLDHLLVSEGIEVVDQSVLEPAGSDHLPVRATLRLRAPGPARS